MADGTNVRKPSTYKVLLDEKTIKPRTPDSKGVFTLAAGEMVQLVKSACCSHREDSGSVPSTYNISLALSTLQLLWFQLSF